MRLHAVLCPRAMNYYFYRLSLVPHDMPSYYYLYRCKQVIRRASPADTDTVTSI